MTLPALLLVAWVALLAALTTFMWVRYWRGRRELRQLRNLYAPHMNGNPNPALSLIEEDFRNSLEASRERRGM